MTEKAISTVVFEGFKFVDEIEAHSNVNGVFVDFAIFIVGWEQRSLSMLESGKVTGKKALLVNFEGDEIPEEERSRFASVASKYFKSVDNKQLCNARSVDQLRGELEKLVNDLAQEEAREIAVDYSSMPRVMVQTLFRLLMSEGVSPRVHWLYTAGLYDDTEVVDADFHQGVSGDLFSVHGAYGAGAVSGKRIGIAALGGDQELVAMFLRHENYDEVFFIDAPAQSSPKLQKKIELQRLWLQAEHGIASDRFHTCDEHNVVDAIKIFSRLISEFERFPNTSFDIFCAGPKSHSIAASAIVSRHENVRLLGRVPAKYARLKVAPTGSCTITTVSDYTNIKIAEVLSRANGSPETC